MEGAFAIQPDIVFAVGGFKTYIIHFGLLFQLEMLNKIAEPDSAPVLYLVPAFDTFEIIDDLRPGEGLDLFDSNCQGISIEPGDHEPPFFRFEGRVPHPD